MMTAQPLSNSLLFLENIEFRNCQKINSASSSAVGFVVLLGKGIVFVGAKAQKQFRNFPKSDRWL
jgi:hypothetical protein